jgi:hypothetical protein
MPTRCDEHADRLLSIEHFLRAILISVIGVFGTVVAAAVAGWFQLEAARVDIRTDCVACPNLSRHMLSVR